MHKEVNKHPFNIYVQEFCYSRQAMCFDFPEDCGQTLLFWKKITREMQ